MAKPLAMSEDEWKDRVDLAAAYRLSAHFGWGNLIYNHIALRVSDQPDCFLVKRHHEMFDEVKASSLLKLHLNGDPVDENEDVNAAGFTIHTAVLNSRNDLSCSLHVHTQVGMAMSAHSGGILPISQGSMRFYNRLSYHDYEGISNDASESERIARDLGARNKAMILRNHGLLTCGRTAGEALTLMRYLIMACEAQLMLESSGCEIRLPSPEVCEHAARQWDRHDDHGGKEEWPAYLRIANRIDPGFRS